MDRRGFLKRFGLTSVGTIAAVVAGEKVVNAALKDESSVDDIKPYESDEYDVKRNPSEMKAGQHQEVLTSGVVLHQTGSITRAQLRDAEILALRSQARRDEVKAYNIPKGLTNAELDEMANLLYRWT